MKILVKLNDYLEKSLLFIAMFLLLGFVVVVFTQVVARNYLKIPIIWSQDVALACFLWSVFLGAAVALRKKQHYVVEVVPERFVLANLLLNLIADILIFVIIYILIYNGFRFARMGLTRISTSLAISQVYFFSSIPVSGVAMFLFNLENMIKDINTLIKYREGNVS